MLTLRLLGPPDLRVDGEPIRPLKTRKGLWLLALLALRAGRPVDRSWLAGVLWPDAEESRALLYLRQALTDLRSALGAEANRIESPTPRTLRLAPEDVEADLWRFDVGLARGDPASLREAAEAYGGPFLEVCLEEWALEERTRRQELRQELLERLAAMEMAAGDPRSAVARLRAVRAAEPLRESALRSLLEALSDAGDHAGVVREYRDFRLALHRELNAEPAQETQSLYRALRERGRSEPPVRATPASAGRLPAPLTPLIGREGEIAACATALRAARLVTLTGIGGVGKTRLAVATASAAADEFSEGAWFVDLAPVADPALVGRAAASALGIAEEPGRPAGETLAERLREWSGLLVLDSCEQVVLGAAALARLLLTECPRLHILATSRQRLGVPGEVERRVPPLASPSVEDEGAEACDAVRLFLECARRARSEFHPSADELRAIGEICRRLDGIPLAIELAAARIRLMSPGQIAGRLADRFRLLAGAAGVAEPRHQTLRVLLDWSYDLLAPAERRLLARLSVFAGGWTIESAEAVCSGDGISPEEVLDHLFGLVDRSLVVTEPAGAGSRCRMLDMVRHYARERLARSGEELHFLERHASHFLHVAADAAERLTGPGVGEEMLRLRPEHENLRAALEYGLRQIDNGPVLRAAAGLQRYWILRAMLVEGRSYLQRALAGPGGGEGERGAALVAAAHLASRQADYDEALSLYEEALSRAAAAGERRLAARAETGLASVARVRGDLEVAAERASRALAVQREVGDQAASALSLQVLGDVHLRRGELESASLRLGEALSISRALGDRAMQASYLNALGMVANQADRLLEARGYFEESLALHREFGDDLNQMANLNNLASIAWSLNEGEEALARFREGLALAGSLGDNRSARMLAYLLEGIAAPLHGKGDSRDAALMIGAADELRERIRTPRAPLDAPDHDALAASVRAALGEEAFALAYAEGRRAPLAEILARATGRGG